MLVRITIIYIFICKSTLKVKIHILLDSGIVTTTRVTHASPAGSYAHAANRQWENNNRVLEDGQDPTACRDIAYQLVHSSPGNKFKVYLLIHNIKLSVIKRNCIVINDFFYVGNFRWRPS